MSFTYAGDPAATNLAAVRFLVGDTDTTDQLINDAEINYILTVETNVRLAAAMTCDAISAKFSRKADTTTLGLSVAASKRAEAYRQRAMDLRSQVGRAAEIFVGGESIADKDTIEDGSDNVLPTFRRGADDYE